jgi:hypothetical protein
VSGLRELTIAFQEGYVAQARTNLAHHIEVLARWEAEVVEVNVQSEAYSYAAAKIAEYERLIADETKSLAEAEAVLDTYRRSMP